jgi:ABC-2 type transport system permease protein
MRAPPGSFLWLVARHLVVSWRRFGGMFRDLNFAMTLALIASAVFLFHLIALPAADWLGSLEADADPSRYHLALAAGVLLILSWVTAQALTNSTRALNANGELDLLLASPANPRSIVASRAVAIAAEAIASVAILAAPVINMNVLGGRYHWLAAYPTLLGAGLLGTAIGLATAVGLFATMGPRRARLTSQISAALIGGGFVLGVQIANLLPLTWRDQVIDLFQRDTGRDAFQSGLAWLPARAIMGEATSLTIWLALCAAAFVLVCVALGERFARIAVACAAIGSTPAAGRERAIAGFRVGAGLALRRKEWLMMARDPYMMSQIFLQIVYVLPIAVVLMHGGPTAGSIAFAVGPAITVITSQLSGAIAWVAISGEDAPDLLASAPLSRPHVERYKIQAIALPVSLILALPMLWFVSIDPGAAALTFLFAAGAGIASACLNLWHPSLGKRRDLMRRHQQSRFVGMMEHLMSLLFAVGCALALIGSLLALLAVALALAVLWFNRKRRTKAAFGASAAWLPTWNLIAQRASSRS